MASQLGINAGQEIIQGIESAKEVGANLVLADRNIQITFSIIWRNVGFWGKSQLIAQIILSIFSNDKITEEELEKMKSQDMLDSILSDFTEHFPKLKAPLIDERDQYLSQKIKGSPGQKVVAVLGAAMFQESKKKYMRIMIFRRLRSFRQSQRFQKSLVG